MKPIQENFDVKTFYLEDDGIFPNSTLPTLFYKGIFELPRMFPASFVQRLFEKNHWSNSWRDGIHTFQHYHSTTHEVLGAYKGKTTVLLGGEKGAEILFEKGDVLVIPAGVAHKNMGGEHDIHCVGAYPEGLSFDLLLGKPEERHAAEENILKVALPEFDPVQGSKGPLHTFWKPL